MKRVSIIAAVALAIAVVTVAAGCAFGPADAKEARKLPKKPPVLMLVMDEWPLATILDAKGRIDAERYPNIAELAGTSTWFPNATTVYDSTTKAVPVVLDGERPRANTNPNFDDHPFSVFDLMGRNGYRISSTESATSICPPRWCRGAKRGRPAILPLLKGDRKGAFDRFSRSVQARPRRFYMRHTLLPHGPWMYLPSGKQMRPNWKDPLPGMNGPIGFHDRYLTEHNEQRLRLQVGFLDHELGRLFARLKRQGTFDQTLIVLTPDHGISSEVGVKDRRTTTRANIDEIAPIPMFFKAPGQAKAKVDRSWVTTMDVVPTIADILDRKLPYRTSGRSAFSKQVRRRRYVRMFKRGLDGSIKVSAKEMLRRRGKIQRRSARLYGTGSWASLYRGIGPRRELIGQPISALSRQGQGAVRASIVNGRLMRSRRASSKVVPAQVAGTLKGSRRDARRDIAVAVNGTIQATGRTFALDGRPRESFAAMVPEGSLRGSRNTVQIFEITGARSLRLLGQA